ncbi:hypothetical protein Tco_0533849 [Tanacetum coccineum]
MEAHLAPTQPTQVNKITTSCEICSGPHNTQYCMEDPEQALLNTHPRIPMKREIIPKDDNSHKNEPEAGVQEVEYFDIFSTKSELRILVQS